MGQLAVAGASSEPHSSGIPLYHFPRFRHLSRRESSPHPCRSSSPSCVRHSWRGIGRMKSPMPRGLTPTNSASGMSPYTRAIFDLCEIELLSAAAGQNCSSRAPRERRPWLRLRHGCSGSAFSDSPPSSPSFLLLWTSPAELAFCPAVPNSGFESQLQGSRGGQARCALSPGQREKGAGVVLDVYWRVDVPTNAVVDVPPSSRVSSLAECNARSDR